MNTPVHVLFAGGGTGGHLYPGLAIARALVRRMPGVRPHFIGAERGIERDVLPTTEFPFTLLDAHPLYRAKFWRNLSTLKGLIGGYREMSRLGATLRPRVIVGTGGYASGIALGWAWSNDVPIVQHIGDSYPGLTARWFARVSREAYLGFPEAESFLPRGKCRYRVTGNPIEPPPDIRPKPAEARAKWRFPPGARVLLVFGGSQGARALNVATLGFIERGLPKSLCVIWSTGRAHYDMFRNFDRPDVRVVPYLSPIADAYAAADLAFVRGGMMGTAELSAWGIPAIICPLPSAAYDHQTSNAVALEQVGAAVHLAQKDLTPERLERDVKGLLDDQPRLDAMARAARARAKPHAAEEIAGHIAQLLGAGGT